MTIEIADCMFLSDIMGAPVPAGKDPQKWTAAAMAHPDRRSAGMSYLVALARQLPTAEDFERVPVEAEKPRHGTDLGQWLIEPDDLCPCESAMRFSDCHGLAPAE